MSSLNRAMLIGRLGKTPELRYSQNGNAILSMSLATDESFTDQNGIRQERTEWHSLVCFNSLAENCAQYLDKGSLIYVEGSLVTRKWQASNGTDRYTTEVRVQRVQFLDRKQDQPRHDTAERSAPPAPPANRSPKNRKPAASSPAASASAMDDVPF